MRNPDRRSTADNACKALSLNKTPKAEKGEGGGDDDDADDEEEKEEEEEEEEAEEETEGCRRRALRRGWRAMVKDGTETHRAMVVPVG